MFDIAVGRQELHVWSGQMNEYTFSSNVDFMDTDLYEFAKVIVVFLDSSSTLLIFFCDIREYIVIDDTNDFWTFFQNFYFCLFKWKTVSNMYRCLTFLINVFLSMHYCIIFLINILLYDLLRNIINSWNHCNNNFIKEPNSFSEFITWN